MAVISSGFASGVSDYPFDVEEFIDRREICDHFRGEEPYDADRAKFLADKIKETCSGTDKELRELKLKYQNDDKVMQILNRFEEEIESENGT